MRAIRASLMRFCSRSRTISWFARSSSALSALAALSKKENSGAQGELKTFSLRLDGSGFAQKELSESLKGGLRTEIKDLVVPAALKTQPLVRLLYMPFDVLNATFDVLDDPGVTVTKRTRNLLSPRKKNARLLSRAS